MYIHRRFNKKKYKNNQGRSNNNINKHCKVPVSCSDKLSWNLMYLPAICNCMYVLSKPVKLHANYKQAYCNCMHT